MNEIYIQVNVLVFKLTIFWRASERLAVAAALAAAVPERSATSHLSRSASAAVASNLRCITAPSARASCSDASADDSDSRVAVRRVCRSCLINISSYTKVKPWRISRGVPIFNIV